MEAYVDQSCLAEEMEYNRVWLGESWGRNAATVLTSIAKETSEIGLGSSILPVYSRSPSLIGQTAATVQEISDGRFRLGIGPSGPVVIENWHGFEYERPLKYTREAVEIIGQVVAGEKVAYDGEFFDLDGFRLRTGAPSPPPAIDVAGMGPKSVELAGRFADGWHALMLTPDGLKTRLDDFRRGSKLGDRDFSSQRVTLSLPCAALEDRERARQSARQHLAFYLGSMGSFYRENLSRQGHEDIVEVFMEEWEQGNRQAAMNLLPETLVDKLAVAGTPAEARERLQGFEDIDGLDSIAISFPRDAAQEEIETTIRELSPK